MNVSSHRLTACLLLAVCLWPISGRCDELFEVQAEGPLVEVIVKALVPARQNNAAADRFEAQIKQVMPHFVQTLRPTLASELAFIRQVCEIPKEQRPKIKAAGEASLQQAARQLAQQQFGGNRRREAGSSNSQPNPRKTIRDALAHALKETLTTEQMARYTSEAEKRTARRKQAAILTAISQLDAVLSLTAEQREKIFQSIASNWDERWDQWLMLPNYGGHYFPQIPDPFVVSQLNAEQRSVWNGLRKVDFGFSGGVGEQAQEDDGWWGDEPAQAAGAPVQREGVLFITE